MVSADVLFLNPQWMPEKVNTWDNPPPSRGVLCSPLNPAEAMNGGTWALWGSEKPLACVTSHIYRFADPDKGSTNTGGPMVRKGFFMYQVRRTWPEHESDPLASNNQVFV